MPCPNHHFGAGGYCPQCKTYLNPERDDPNYRLSQPLHPYCGKCGWRKGGIHSWDGNACRCGHTAPAIVFEVDAHPVDVLRDLAPQLYPAFEIDEESFRDAKTRLDATIADLGTGPLEPE